MNKTPLRALMALFGLAAIALLAARCRASEGVQPDALKVRVVAAYPHDPSMYTQGLLWHDGTLYESAGQYGASRLRQVALASGETLRELALPDSVFAEGLARIDDRLVLISWHGERGWVFDLESFTELAEISYQGDGWGLCYDGASLWMSDGSSRLVRRDTQSFDILGELDVTLNGEPLPAVNELACAEGWIYGNLYGSEQIVRIDPLSGKVSAVIDASGLLTADERQGVDVLNGIAYDPEQELFYITGKLWPKLFAITFE